MPRQRRPNGTPPHAFPPKEGYASVLSFTPATTAGAGQRCVPFTERNGAGIHPGITHISSHGRSPLPFDRHRTAATPPLTPACTARTRGRGCGQTGRGPHTLEPIFAYISRVACVLIEKVSTRKGMFYPYSPVSPIIQTPKMDFTLRSNRKFGEKYVRKDCIRPSLGTV